MQIGDLTGRFERNTFQIDSAAQALAEEWNALTQQHRGNVHEYLVHEPVVEALRDNLATDDLNVESGGCSAGGAHGVTDLAVWRRPW